jgi:hypothetical protein
VQSVFSLIAGMIDAMKKIVSVGEGFVIALSVEKQLVFFKRGSFQKQMNHQHICYWWAHEVLYNLCSSPMAAVIDVKWRRLCLQHCPWRSGLFSLREYPYRSR